MGSLYTKKNGKDKSGNQKYKPDPNKYLYNIDTFYYNCRSHMYGEVMDRGLRSMLIAGRTHASDSETHDNLTIDLKLPGYKNNVEFKIMAGQAPMYQYSIRNDSMAVYFRKNDHDTGAHMKVQINQFVLWEKGFEKAYEESLTVLKTLGFVPYDCKINRIDFAVHSDQFKWTLDDMKTFDYPRNIAGDNFPGFHRLNPITGTFETMYVGTRGRLYLRLYDKSKEIKDNGKQYFNQIYKKMGMDIDNVWNFEIECNRAYLKDLVEEHPDSGEFIKIFDDIDYCLEQRGLSKLWSFLIDKYHHNSAHWTVLQQGDAESFERLNEHNITIEKDIDANYDRELNQIAGRMMMGVLDQDDYSLENAIRIFRERYLDKMEDGENTWLDKVEGKKAAIHSLNINKSIKNNKIDRYFNQLSNDLKVVTKPTLHESLYMRNQEEFRKEKNPSNG